MGKLIELLNEYNNSHHNKSNLYYLFEIENGMLFCYDDVTDVQRTMQDEAMVICSKKFGFIERLVENDYINMNKVERDAISYFTDESPVYGNEIWTDRLIMMLSVSNFPIKDLIYYLGKEDEHYTEHGGYKLVFNAKKS